VPLCRGHHRQLHQTGDEIAWWKGIGVNALEVTRSLWEKTHAATDEALVRQLIADVKPADIIEKVEVRDIVDLTWEILRWRRIKKTLISLHMASTI